MISKDKLKTLSSEEAKALVKEIHDAPMLELEHDRDIMVKRVGLLSPYNRPVVFLQTPAGGYMRLPDGLAAWAFDLSSLALVLGDPFPCLVSFGRHSDGSYWAELQ